MLNTDDLSPVFLRSELTILFSQQSANMADLSRVAIDNALKEPAAPVAIARSIEPLYAHLKSEGVAAASDVATVLGRIAHYIGLYGMFGMGQRAPLIEAACRRALGETVSSEDPAIDPAFVPAEETEAEPDPDAASPA